FASAQTEKAQCGASPAALPAPLAGWATRIPMPAAKDGASLDRARLEIGQGVDAALRHTSEVKFAAMPDRPGGSVSFGGMVSFEVTAPGIYRVAIGSGAWIDVLEDGAAVTSSAHGHGPECSGIRKMVDYPLKAGRHVLQLSGNADSTLSVLIARVP